MKTTEKYVVGQFVKCNTNIYSDLFILDKFLDNNTLCYKVIFKDDLGNSKDDLGNIKEDKVMVLTEKKLDLFHIGYFKIRGEHLKFDGIYDGFKAVYACTPGGSGAKYKLESSPFEILDEDEIKVYKSNDFLKYMCSRYGIESDEPIYEVNDIVKFSHEGKDLLGEINSVNDIDDSLSVLVNEVNLEIFYSQVLVLFKKDKRLVFSLDNGGI